MRNIALFLTYEGTSYHGWQMQKNLPDIHYGKFSWLAALIKTERMQQMI